MVEPQERLERKKRLLAFYDLQSPVGTADNDRPPQVTKDDLDPTNIDSSSFDRQAYFTKLLQQCDLNDLMTKEIEVTEQMRALDSEMQTLVYDNYNKFIVATDTIKMMKTDFKFIENEMNSLAEAMVEISQLSASIDKKTHKHREELKRLSSTKQNLQKLNYLSSLPTKLREHIQKEQWAEAVNAYCKARPVFEKFCDVPSFQGLQRDCLDLINTVSANIEIDLSAAPDAASLTSSIETLQKLNHDQASLASKFLLTATLRMDELFVKLDQEVVHPVNSPDGSDSSSPVTNRLLVSDVLHFANIVTDTILDGALTYTFAFINLFLRPSTLTESSAEDDSSRANLGAALFDFLDSVTQKFFGLVESRLRLEAGSPDPALLVRAIERIHSRLGNFGRSMLEVLGPEWAQPEVGGSNGNELLTADQFKMRLDDACLQTLLRVVSVCSQHQLQLLRLQTADCFTDIRHQLLQAARTDSSSLRDHDNRVSITDIYHSLSRTLVENLRSTLKKLEAFLSPDHTLSQVQLFRATFALENVREGLVAAYLRFLIQFCEDLSMFMPPGLPGVIRLLTGKLCLDWASSGTVGHLLSLADDFLLIGLPKATALAKSQQQTLFKQMQCLLVNRRDPLTAPGPLSDQLRTVSTLLFTSYVKFEGAQIAHMMRRSVEARDWFKCPEPRSVRSVIRRILEDFNTMDSQVSQLLPAKHRPRDRGSGDFRSWHSSFQPTGLRGSQHASEAGGGSSVKNLELDHTLAYQLRRLFFQRTDIFAPVEATRESILFGVIKIGLKAFVECARTRVFSKFGLHQIQVDCHFLHIHLWKFVSDEKQLQAVLEDVLSSVVQRCIEPELMDDSVVDAVCCTTKSGSNPSI
ncbi:Vacuolar protein sorting-associated protein 51 [Sparganum proliferum]